MGKISLLPDALINKIAAGEVVERPASVVKELVENSLDSGARRIQINIVNGGRDLISVLDDGQGMGEEDTRLAVLRHATSKISREEHLEAIATLGFRGEALASIAAVSRFELTSCRDELEGGFRLVLEGGREISAGRVGFPRGTRVVVEELFLNTPARRKFLRAAATELQHIQQAVINSAFANPGVGFRLTHNNRTLQDLPPASGLGERTLQLLGPEFAAGLLAVSGGEGLLSYEGLVSRPSFSQSSRRWQYLFVNGRHVRNPGIQHAIGHAYRTLLMKDRHPAYILMLNLQPSEVDVNVHPAKTEVRLRNPQLVHTVLSRDIHRQVMESSRSDFSGRAVSAAEGRVLGDLRQGDLGVVSYAGAQGREQAGDTEGDQSAAASWGGVQDSRLPATQGPENSARIFRGRYSISGDAGEYAGEQAGRPEEELAAAPSGRGPEAGMAEGMTEGMTAGMAAGMAVNPLSGGGFHFQPLVTGAGRETALLDTRTVVLSQFHNTYILAQRGDTLLLVDQHAAHERILFEQYRSQFYEGRMLTEPYLLPPTLELSAQNALLLEQYLPQWKKMGFGIEPFGRNTFRLEHVPALISGRNVEGLIMEVLDELALFGKSGRLEEVFNEILERTACHSAIRAGMTLSREEMEALMGQLSGLEINLYCPHGRPVWVDFPLAELERRFKRTV
ncbi:MAG: DNA mismatch repair endonuclease MutL [Deltaproteobacteria bacterium]|nr:DNA mismatch repair endonuclease MutL [Deltaproteobacteria bacterium]